MLGKNGAGKTTLLKLISGLLFPTEGQININGNSPMFRRPAFLEQIFLVPEEFDLPRMSMKEYAKEYGRFYPNFSTTQMAELMKVLEVDEDHNLHQMSFGQKKKAYIAFAIACNTPLLIMDEPTNGLDIPSKSSFRRVIASVTDEQRTVIISTHQVRDLDKLIDSVVILDESDILLNTTTQDITDKLYFTHLQEGEQAIYSEDTIHGTWGVKPNSEGLESPLDMEILFNAAISQKETIKKIFNSPKQ